MRVGVDPIPSFSSLFCLGCSYLLPIYLPILSPSLSYQALPLSYSMWYEDLMAQAQARRLCIQWDITGAITLVASDAVWNAVFGNMQHHESSRCSGAG